MGYQLGRFYLTADGNELPANTTLWYLRNSSRSTWNTCRQKWDWAYNEGLRSAGYEPPYLTFGTDGHTALELYYPPGVRRGVHPAETFVKVAEERIKALGGRSQSLRDNEEVVDYIDLGRDVFTRYVEHWKEADKRWKIVAPEMPFQTHVLRASDGRYLYTATGIIDGVIQDRSRKRNSVGAWDHKTTGSISTGYLELDEQASFYHTFAPAFLQHKGFIHEKERLSFFLFNFIRRAMGDYRPQDEHGRRLNKDGSVSKKQPPPFFERASTPRGESEALSVMERTYHQVVEMRRVQQGKMPVYKMPSKDCTWCQFKDLCVMEETDSDVDSLKKLTMTGWEPYAQHEIELGELR